jgi:hypothetical protein
MSRIIKKVPLEDIWMYHEFRFGENHRPNSIFYEWLRRDVEKNGFKNPLFCIEKVRNIQELRKNPSWNQSYEEWLKNPGRRDWVQRDGAPYKLIGGTEGIYGNIPNLDQDAGGNNRFLLAIELGVEMIEIEILPNDLPQTIHDAKKLMNKTNLDNYLGLI